MVTINIGMFGEVRTSIGIYTSRGEWHEKYRVKDEEEIKEVNDIWKKILKRNNEI